MGNMYTGIAETEKLASWGSGGSRWVGGDSWPRNRGGEKGLIKHC